MTHTIVIPNKIMATNVDTLNRTAVSGSDLDNGWIFRLDSYSSGSGEGEVFAATQVATGSLVNVWMALTPEVVSIVAPDGSIYKGINEDPRNFYNIAGDMIDAVKLQAGDIVTLTADAFSGAISTHHYGNATTGLWTLVWGDSEAPNALCLHLLATTYISIGSGTIDTQRVTAYKLEVLAN
jgi:hypothetical protein